ncbi:MAG: RNA polymerase sigma factor [Candidatus Nanopelagicales bacterium]
MSDSQQRAEVWLTDLYYEHSGAVLSYARRRLESTEDAEDVVVEVFATAWRRRDIVPDAPRPWLYATAANVIAHVIRGEARRTRLGTRLAAVRPLHVAEADPGEEAVDRDLIGTALAELSDADAELLRLWAWEQLEPAEIALVLGCSPGTARTRLHRARGRMRACLAQHGVRGAESTDEPQPAATGQEESR